MAKFYGAIGFAITSESADQPGVWTENFVERKYYGDVQRLSRSLQNNSSVNGEINLSKQISILCDPFANENFSCIRYVNFMGANWTVTNVDVQFPRLILSIGGLYNVNSN